ncbi:hypothetical protein [Deinococcus ruber]|uniref:Uncharacterized protein n=1 Tax=Deinococcus ruber TaxID=1848197 RepID=A0A918CQZ0_9DEIO|nr:hypothetical protein [Deinococcus ruber]GGR34509.1 hypothetical protein GCM10008957_50740 [Deinococcus ruber]
MKYTKYLLLCLLIIILFFSFHGHISTSDLYGKWICAQSDSDISKDYTSLELNKDGSFTEKIFNNKNPVSLKHGKYDFNLDGASTLTLNYGDYSFGTKVGSDMTFGYSEEVLCTKESK